jgi:molybdopterin synthase catalytic subunit
MRSISSVGVTMSEDRAVGRVALASVTTESIEPQEHLHAVESVEYGAVSVFAGIVRNHDHERPVTSLAYSGHPSAQAIMDELAAQAAARPGVGAVAVSHRIGPLAISEAALIVAVSAAHRQPAIETCAWLVEEVKARLPIWKEQTFADGRTEWVNCP